MITKINSPFRNQIFVIHKQLQVLKLREYIYNYLCKMETVSEAEASAIANLEAESRLEESEVFTQNDVRYINGRLEEIEKLTYEICNIAV